MLAMEAAFGISGLVAAPIYYAYVKDELTERGVSLGPNQIQVRARRSLSARSCSKSAARHGLTTPRATASCTAHPGSASCRQLRKRHVPSSGRSSTNALSMASASRWPRPNSFMPGESTIQLRSSSS